MEITIRIYTKHNGRNSSREITFDEGEIDEMVSRHLSLEQYVGNKEIIETITYENIKL